MIEKKTRQKLTKTKLVVPVVFGSKVFSPEQLKMSKYYNEFLEIYHAFLEYSHILWEATLPPLVMSVNRLVTRFFSNQGDITNLIECMRLRVAI